MFPFLGFVTYAPVTSEPAPAAPTSGVGGLSGIFVWLIIMVALFYFMIIMPQRRREKQFKQMMSQLKVGDRIVTAGGILGKVVTIKDNTVRVKTGNGSEIDVTRRSITAIIGKGENPNEVNVEKK
ncbi:MAG: preprotein translocase subunit YajC [Thermotogae bacterium]|uniref:preprotein translocase subunit YajC n=1 Tax=Kosmotoga sp. TaxID=1955248 RepID=UPI000F1DE56F|nr:preprotein translocase subunit YajC [Kosmotoga sp.]MBO8165683.1 preprotein translocase subunit YajC [Kosmotoga sp.]MCD6160542.1 preprotein translocase subunit YajC [Kosmotoga sp.]RKX49459.1 MAG: preprotein translocase subunit YajC [Thermotogota bacterium]